LNELQKETSPYLRQHADNPVHWYPWGKEAFDKAKRENKPVFLSIGYSTCHWCHVMAHESFEDEEIAALLNQSFVSIKVDREERPDIDSLYMSVCQAFTGRGGWPTSIFMTPDQKPFFAGTYFPKQKKGRMIGMRELLPLIRDKWQKDRQELTREAEAVVRRLLKHTPAQGAADAQLLEEAVLLFRRIYDSRNGGFGPAPKFPTPHSLLFLMAISQRYHETDCLEMAEKTLVQMYRGGIFDHIGFGFCRYSTDEKYLVPHFEKMLYDNALLILAYCRAHACTQAEEHARLYLEVAEKTADFVLREMTSHEGAFFSAQDADSDGEEGKYYVFVPDEIEQVLGKQKAEAFCRRYDITSSGNFEGKSIPNLLKSNPFQPLLEEERLLLERYRKSRCSLHLDDKILTAWNGLMIAALCELYRTSCKRVYLDAAQKADQFIREQLVQDGTLYVSFAGGKRGVKAFLDDYAAYCFAQIGLYKATLERCYLDRAAELCEKVFSDFTDEAGGFYLCGKESEQLIVRPKETYDGAMPSGNSLMAWNLVQLHLLTGGEKYRKQAERQLDFLSAQAGQYPIGYTMYLLALLDDLEPPAKVTVVLAKGAEKKEMVFRFPQDVLVEVLDQPKDEYPLKNGQTTYYVCRGHQCLAPVNEWNEGLLQ